MMKVEAHNRLDMEFSEFRPLYSPREAWQFCLTNKFLVFSMITNIGALLFGIFVSTFFTVFAICLWWAFLWLFFYEKAKKTSLGWMIKGRLDKNQCTFCAYDLRGHEPSQNCPECNNYIIFSSRRTRGVTS